MQCNSMSTQPSYQLIVSHCTQTSKRLANIIIALALGYWCAETGVIILVVFLRQKFRHAEKAEQAMAQQASQPEIGMAWRNFWSQNDQPKLHCRALHINHNECISKVKLLHRELWNFLQAEVHILFLENGSVLCGLQEAREGESLPLSGMSVVVVAGTNWQFPPSPSSLSSRAGFSKFLSLRDIMNGLSLSFLLWSSPWSI